MGTYQVEGARLTISPQRAKATLRDAQGNVLESSKPALERVAYVWELVYPDAIQEAQLRWTPPKPTQRDGTPNGGNSLPGGYILLSPKAMHWKY